MSLVKRDQLPGLVRPFRSHTDKEKYSEDEESKSFTLSLLDEKSRKDRDDYVKECGYLTLDQIRSLFKTNNTRDSYTPDAEMMIMIDSRTDQKIFIEDNTVYDRDTLFNAYPFDILECEPEDYFSRQMVAKFVDPKDKDRIEYIAKDEDDSTPFIKILDQIKKHDAEKKGEVFIPEQPVQIVRTKIFLAKKNWENFLTLAEVAMGIIKSRMSGAKSSPFLRMLLGGDVKEELLALGYKSQ